MITVKISPNDLDLVIASLGSFRDQYGMYEHDMKEIQTLMDDLQLQLEVGVS